MQVNVLQTQRQRDVSHAALRQSRGVRCVHTRRVEKQSEAGYSNGHVVPDGVFTFGSVFADFDDDGYPDLFVSGDFQTSVMFWNNGNGTFTEDTLGDVGLGLDENGMGVAVADVDGDMRLDLFVSGIYADHETGPSRDPTSPFGSRGNVLYRNMGNRVFQEVKHSGLEDGGWAWGSVFLDANNDANLELFLVNGFRVPETSYEDLFWNVSPNRFWVRDQRNGQIVRLE